MSNKPKVTCLGAVEVILKNDPSKKWFPYEIQTAIREKYGKIYSESTITARLRDLKIPAQRFPNSSAHTYQWAA